MMPAALRRRLAAAALATGVLASVACHAQEPSRAANGAALPADLRDLPLIEVPAAPAAAPGGDVFALLITGDGGWAKLDREMAATFASRGIPVVGLDARAYLDHPRTPDEAARDVSRILNDYTARWGRGRVLLVGYSRGADMAPFILTRLAPDLRRRIVLVAMLGLAERASFEFHWSDLITETSRPTDLPIAPELARLRGSPMLCVYGREERESGCRGADSTLVRIVAREGKHHFDGQYAAIAELILAALP